MATYPLLDFACSISSISLSSSFQGFVSGAVQRGDLRPALEALRPGEEAQDLRGLGQEGFRHRSGTAITFFS